MGRSLRALALSALAAGCSVDDVSLEGKACPCVTGWFCDRGTCVRGDGPSDAGERPDAAVTPDAGPDAAPAADAGDAAAPIDAGADAAGPPDAGADAGPPVTVTVQAQVESSSDDAEECVDGTSGSDPPGSIYIGSSDLELVDATDGTYCFGNQVIGLRFESVAVPAGATVVEAHLELDADESDSEATSLTLSAQAADDPPTFTTTLNDVTSRSRGTARVSWADIPSWTAGDTIESPDLASLVQEVVDRPGFSTGNAIVLFIEGTGKRVVESYDGMADQAAILHVSYVE